MRNGKQTLMSRQFRRGCKDVPKIGSSLRRVRLSTTVVRLRQSFLPRPQRSRRAAILADPPFLPPSGAEMWLIFDAAFASQQYAMPAIVTATRLTVAITIAPRRSASLCQLRLGFRVTWDHQIRRCNLGIADSRTRIRVRRSTLKWRWLEGRGDSACDHRRRSIRWCIARSPLDCDTTCRR